MYKKENKESLTCKGISIHSMLITDVWQECLATNGSRNKGRSYMLISSTKNRVQRGKGDQTHTGTKIDFCSYFTLGPFLGYFLSTLKFLLVHTYLVHFGSFLGSLFVYFCTLRPFRSQSRFLLVHIRVFLGPVEVHLGLLSIHFDFWVYFLVFFGPFLVYFEVFWS